MCYIQFCYVVFITVDFLPYLFYCVALTHTNKKLVKVIMYKQLISEVAKILGRYYICGFVQSIKM